MLNKLLKEYINNPKDGNVCFRLGMEYENIGQTSSAAGFYVRSIEFGFDVKLQYEALCRIALCFEKQGNRWFMIKDLEYGFVVNGFNTESYSRQKVVDTLNTIIKNHNISITAKNMPDKLNNEDFIQYAQIKDSIK